MKTKRFPAVRTQFWTVYKQYTLLGNPVREPIASFPSPEDAQSYAKNYAWKRSMPSDKICIESMPVTMRAWEA